jgi:hypothetical protein
MGVTAEIFLTSILLKEMRYIVFSCVLNIYLNINTVYLYMHMYIKTIEGRLVTRPVG